MSTNTNVQNLSDQMIQIGTMDFTSATIGTDINDRLDNIDKNFKSILSSEYLKGIEGDSIVTTEVTLTATKSDPLTEGEKLYQEFSKLIYEDAKPTEDFLNGKSVVLIQQKDSLTGETITVSSLPFVFKDPELENTEAIENYNDRSCIIYYNYTNKSWQTIQTFPTFYYNEDLGDFCWKINGSETQLRIQGAPGKTGDSGADCLLVKGVKDTSPSNVITVTHVRVENRWIPINNPTLGLKDSHTVLIAIEKTETTVSNEQTIQYQTYDCYLGTINKQKGGKYVAYVIDDPLYLVLSKTNGYIPQTAIEELLEKRLGKLIDKNQPKEFSQEVAQWANSKFATIVGLTKAQEDISAEIQNEIKKYHKNSILQLEIANIQGSSGQGHSFELKNNTILYIPNISLDDKRTINIILPNLTDGVNIYQCGFNMCPTGVYNEGSTASGTSASLDGKLNIFFYNPDNDADHASNVYIPSELNSSLYSQYRREYILTGYPIETEGDLNNKIKWFMSASDYTEL